MIKYQELEEALAKQKQLINTQLDAIALTVDDAWSDGAYDDVLGTLKGYLTDDEDDHVQE